MKTTKHILLLVILLMAAQVHAQRGQQPNILFIEVDDLTAKYLGCFGAEFAKTPTIDELAKNGVVFENAVCQGAMCGPSRNSLISGLYPHNMGFYENKQLPSLPKGVWTFPKALQQQGYETFWIGKCHIRPYMNDIEIKNKVEKKKLAMQNEMGFNYVWESAGRSVALKTAKKRLAKGKNWKEGKDAYGDFLNEKGLLEKFVEEGGKVPTTLDGDTEYMDGFFTTKTIEQLSKRSSKAPFFMWVNFSCPHGPFDVPQKYHDMFDPKDMPTIIEPASEQFAIPDNLKPHPNKKGAKGTAKLRAEYSATIAYMDAQVGRLVRYIKSSEYAKNTVIVFFSDHGIMTGDHGLIHKSTLFKEVLNPSLIISFPSQYKAKREKAPAELLDLGKTVLDIAGAKQSAINECPNGYSLLPLLTGKGKYQRPNVAFSEIEGFRSAFDGQHKYIDNQQLPILFNLKTNADETQNFVKSESKEAKRLKKAHDAWIQQSGEIKPPVKPVRKKNKKKRK